MTRFAQIDLESPDPTDAINAFLWNMSKARSLGFTPPYKWVVAEHFLRDDVSLMYYSAGGGALLFSAKDDALGSEESWDFLRTLMEKAVERRKTKELAEAATPEASDPASGETERTLPVMPRQRGGLARAAHRRTAAGDTFGPTQERQKHEPSRANPMVCRHCKRQFRLIDGDIYCEPPAPHRSIP